MSYADVEYPAQLLARDAAPSYEGEGPFALWHFSEDASLSRFEPRPSKSNPQSPPLVWAVDTRHMPMFWFPRQCPRACIWPTSTTTDEDRDHFFAQSSADRLHVVETAWLAKIASSHLYACRLPPDAFRPHEVVGGYWIADEPVEAIEQKVFEELLGLHARARIELWITPSIWSFWRQVAASTVGFSGCRLQNAAPYPDRVSPS